MKKDSKKTSTIKLIFAWIVWGLTYGVGILFGIYMIYSIFLKPSAEEERINKHLLEIYKSRN